MKNLFSLIIFFVLVTSCKNNAPEFDASGTFEAEETIISAQATGVIKELQLEEGQELKVNQYIGFIDSTQLYLKKVQLQKQISALLEKKPNINAQLAAYNEQLRTAVYEKNRVANLYEAGAATAKQVDDSKAIISVINKQIEAQKSTLNITRSGMDQDANPLRIQIDQLNDQLQKCQIINEVNGTVLSKYTEVNEMATPGKPLYKIADLSTIILRVYITGNQLPIVKLNQVVTVSTDDGNGGFHQTEGKIMWINDKAEFTPKTIQTKNERANLVYAIKVKVKNDGRYKIGMYGEIKF